VRRKKGWWAVPFGSQDVHLGLIFTLLDKMTGTSDDWGKGYRFQTGYLVRGDCVACCTFEEVVVFFVSAAHDDDG